MTFKLLKNDSAIKIVDSIMVWRKLAVQIHAGIVPKVGLAVRKRATRMDLVIDKSGKSGM